MPGNAGTVSERSAPLGYSVAQTARLVCALRWVCGRLSEILEAWATEGAASDAVELTALSRRLASHRERIDGLQPDSELMASWRQAAPADRTLAAALDEIAELEAPADRLEVASQVILPQLARACREIVRQAAPHCDAALASAAQALLDDLDRASDGMAASGGAARPGAAETAERALSAAGGIVGPSLLRPEGWP